MDYGGGSGFGCGCNGCSYHGMLQEEGIVIKALDSPYKLNDRSGSWLKVKPDYVDSGEFDAASAGGGVWVGLDRLRTHERQ